MLASHIKYLVYPIAFYITILSPLKAAEYIRAEEISPSSAKEDAGTFEHEFKEDALLPKLGRRIKKLPEFISESKLTPHFRAYSLSREFSDKEDPEALAVGGELRYSSPLIQNTFSIDASYFLSHGIHDDGGDGTLLLGSNASDINVLGKFVIKIPIQNMQLRLYRQEFNLPYLNKHDIRMIPNTHEAYVLGRKGTRLDFVTGQVTKIKLRDAESFISIAEAAGAKNKKRGLSMAGFRYHLGDNSSIGAIDYYAWDTINILYSELHFTHEWNDEVASSVSGQFTHQKSIGDELIGTFDTNQYGMRVRTSYKNAILTLAATNTGSGSPIQSPFGGRPSYLSLMRQDFDRANEVGFLVGLSYNFARLGLPDLSAFTNFAWGNNAEDASDERNLPDETEYDFTVDFRPKSGALNGFWLRARYAHVDFEGGEDTQDTRVILNYELPF